MNKNWKPQKLDGPLFHGWDWTELANEWGIYIDDYYWIAGGEDFHPLYSDFDIVSFYLKGVIRDYDGYDTYVMKKCGNDIRSYLKMLSYGVTTSTPLWKGLSNIDDNYTIIDWTIDLIGRMWN